MRVHLLVQTPLLAFLVTCGPAMESERAAAGSEVLEAIRTRGEAAVLIALVPPAGFGEPGSDLVQVQAAIARAQDEVLAALDSADYRNRQRFASVPALAGTLRTERGLRILRSHPRVRRVDLDPAGGGTGGGVP